MARIKISLNLLAVPGSMPIKVPTATGNPIYGVFIPSDQLFIPADKQGAAHLTATLIETPKSQFNDFAIRPFVEKSRFESMTDQQKAAIPFIGSGKYLADVTPTNFTAAATTVDASEAVQLPSTQMPLQGGSEDAPY